MSTGRRNVWRLELNAEDGWKTNKDMVRECGSGYGGAGYRKRICQLQEEMETKCYEEEVQHNRKMYKI